MEIAEKDLLYTFLNKHVKVVHKRGDLIFINRGKFLDIDDIFNVSDILPEKMKEKYSIVLVKSDAENQENPMGLGYLKIDKIQ